MQLIKTYLSDTRIKLDISADQKLIDGIKTVVLRHLAKDHVKLPGFRSGKAPLSMVEKSVDQELLHSEFLDEAVNRLYVQAMQAEKLRPVEQPKITLKKFVPFTQLEFEAEVEVIGEIKLPNYKTMKQQPAAVKVEAKDVTEVLSSLQQRMAERSGVQRASKKGDEVLIDFSGKDSKGQRVKGADGKDYPLILGSNTFIPGFEEHLFGLKHGDDTKFDVTFPKDYGVAALQSKKVTFSVSVKQVQEVVAPKLDDSFAAKSGPFKTLTELKTDIKKQLTIERQQQADRDFENQLVRNIAAKSSVAIPEVLIDEEVKRAEEGERQNLAYRGQTWQEHLDEEGITEEEHRRRNRDSAQESVKAGLVLSEISEQEGIKVTPEEFEIRLQLLKGQYTDNAMQAELDTPNGRRDIENSLLTEKTLAKLTVYAKKHTT
ncbi:MAG TPA: trigger factor [Patescibacteria group bacterium]|nr:trigger factor [Patescibacteria group bacterium]